LDGLDPVQYMVSYYLTEDDAESGTSAIPNPLSFTNTVPFAQEVWVRVEDSANGCHKVVPLELIVNPLPVLMQPEPLELCDYNNPGDEQESFVLEDSTAGILGGQVGIALSYHLTMADAQSGDNAL
ncbi:hypothetical protein, partial [Mangrovimonas sp. TPBH4]|uniref:hypothetical protein n=1 Tax=Mangrovimonas sp. TPBH4 TaxID=1645914 RepID=UPI000B1595A7